MHFRSINAHAKPFKLTGYRFMVKENFHRQFFKHCFYMKFSYKIGGESEDVYDRNLCG
jgi:hypothetical protein